MFLHGFMSFAAICAIIACLLIMGSFVLIMMNLQHMITDLEQESEILVYIDEDLTTAEAKSVGSNINMITNVDESIFVSREQALEDYIAQQDDPSIFEGVEADTLRDRFRVSLRDISQTERTVAEIEQIDGVAKVSAHYEISNGFTTMQSILNVASAAIILILFVVSLFIIANTVKLAPVSYTHLDVYKRQVQHCFGQSLGSIRASVRLGQCESADLMTGGQHGQILSLLLSRAMCHDRLAAQTVVSRHNVTGGSTVLRQFFDCDGALQWGTTSTAVFLRDSHAHDTQIKQLFNGFSRVFGVAVSISCDRLNFLFSEVGHHLLEKLLLFRQ